MSRPPDAMSVATEVTRLSGRSTRLLMLNPSRPAVSVISKTPRVSVLRIVDSVRATSLSGNASKYCALIALMFTPTAS